MVVSLRSVAMQIGNMAAYDTLAATSSTPLCSWHVAGHRLVPETDPLRRTLYYRSNVGYMTITTTMIRYTTIESHISTMTGGHTVHVEQVETIPDDAAVFHYDELDETLKHRFPALTAHAPTKASIHPKSVLSNGDYVKFTEYYRVTCQ